MCGTETTRGHRPGSEGAGRAAVPDDGRRRSGGMDLGSAPAAGACPDDARAPGRARRSRRARDGEGAGAGARRLSPGAGRAPAAWAPGGCDLAAPRLPRESRDGQDHGRAAARGDVPSDGLAEPRPSRRGRPGRARRAVRRHDGDQDRPGDPARARRRPLHRRGVRARAGRRTPGLRAGGDRDAAQANGGLPAPPRRDRGRLSPR